MLEATNGEVEYSYLSPKLEKANYKVDSFENLLMALNYVFLLEESKGNSQARAYSGTLETRIKIYRHDILNFLKTRKSLLIQIQSYIR